MALITGCDCGESLARALGGFALRGSIGPQASPIAECAWCGAPNAEAEFDLARRN